MIKANMNKATKMHLESVTPENLETWREEVSYSSFASSTGRKGHIDIGVNGKGFYVVRQNGSAVISNSAKEAVDRYSELVSD